MARLTATQQRNAVSEGFALGLLICGRDRLPFDKVMADLAFEGAWPLWSHRHVFPQVSTDIHNGTDGSLVMTRATERKQTFSLYWDRDRELIIQSRREGSDVVVADVLRVLDGGVPRDAWEALAAEFLRRFERVD